MSPCKALAPPHPTPPPLSTLASAFMSLFFSPSFFVSSSNPIWCVWTRPLGANSLPWTPSAVWLSTVNWAWLAVAGRDGAVLSPVQHAAFCRPASPFTRGSTHRRRGCVTKRGCLSSISTPLIWFSVLNDSCSGAPRQNHLFSLNLRLFQSLRKSVRLSLHGLFPRNMIQKQYKKHSSSIWNVVITIHLLFPVTLRRSFAGLLVCCITGSLMAGWYLWHVSLGGGMVLVDKPLPKAEKVLVTPNLCYLHLCS